MPPRKTAEPSCLYPDEKELARVLLGERSGQWKTICKIEERHGLPRISPVYGGRYWPAVKAFYDRRHRMLDEQMTAPAEDREGENFDD